MKAFAILCLVPVLVYANGNQSQTKLFRAIECGDIKSIVETQDIKEHASAFPLLHALSHQQYDVAMLLLEKGARADVEDDLGETPLIAATKNHLLSKRMLEKMLASGAVLEHAHQKTGMTAMMYASKVGFVKGMSLLSDFGATFDRVNLRDGKGVLDYASDPETIEYLMKSHRYMGKSLERYGYKLDHDELGFPRQLAMGADGILFWVKQGNDLKIAKFCYQRSLLQTDGVIEYEKCRHREEVLAKEWNSWFDNNLLVQSFDAFSIKNHIRGKTLAQWMTASDTSRDFGASDALAVLARQKLRELIIRMIKNGRSFVGDLNPSNLIFSEQRRDWVVIDGHKAVSCYSPADHEWIWLEYCEASGAATKESVLKAFKSYAVGPNPTGSALDDESFGIWLKPRLRNGRLEGPTEGARAMMIELIEGISEAELN